MLRNLVCLLLVASLVSAGCLSDAPGPNEEIDEGIQENATATFVTDRGNASLTLEVADTPEERERGLMYRRSLEEGRGMVFVYDDEAVRSFWMKNTYIPLDMIFIDSEGRVVDVDHAHPQPNASSFELETYESDAPAMYVVETRRGFANRTGVSQGTRVELEIPSRDGV